MAITTKLDADEKCTSAILITELIADHSDKKTRTSGSETWSCAFSNNGTYFAWSAGNCIVTLIPWSFCKNTLFKYQEVTVPFKPGERSIIEEVHETKECFGCNTVTIHTGHLVRSLAFGSSFFNYATKSSPPFWNRLSSSKDLLLCTGHINGRIRLWDIFTGKLILELLDHTDVVSYLAFSPVGDLILMSASYDGTLKVWDLHDDGNMSHTFKMNNKPIYCCCWSSDASTLVSVGMCKLVYVWDMKSFQVKFKLKGHQHDVVSCAFSPDGSLIATASWDTKVILWDSHTSHLLKYFSHLYPSPHPIFANGDNGTWIRDVSFSSDGAHIATVADDGYLRVWDIESKDDPESIAVSEDSLCCFYAPSGSTLAVGNRRGSVMFWSAPACIKPLLYLARLQIRKKVSAQDVSKLAIPRSLVDYLLYKDLE